MNPLHDHVLDRLDAYLDGTLSPADAAEVRRHCRACESCRAAFESLGAACPGNRTRLRPEDRASPSRPGGRGRRFWQSFWMTWAAAAVVLAGVFVYYATLEPSPYDLRVLGQSSWLTGLGRGACTCGCCGTTAGRSRACRSRSSWPVRARATALACSSPA